MAANLSVKEFDSCVDTCSMYLFVKSYTEHKIPTPSEDMVCPDADLKKLLYEL